MRTYLLAVLFIGCGGTNGGGGDDTGGDEPQGVVSIDGEGMVAVTDGGNTALPGSPFSCTGGNCGGTDIVTTATSIKFTPTAAGGSTFSRATIEHGDSGTTTPVTPNTAITVSPSNGWRLQVVFE